MLGLGFGMSGLEIRSQSGGYAIEFDSDSPAQNSTGLTVVDNNVPTVLIGPSRGVLSLEVSERIKTLSTVEEIVSAMRDSGSTRASQLVAVGGGVVQDLATLSASLYMRGVDWVYFPTTLASMVDSCVGGKSSINVSGSKNIIGNIYPPSRVIVNTRFLDSLPIDEYLCGLSEGVKICFAKGETEFSSFVSNPAALMNSGSESTEALVMLSLTSKKWFVEIDENDKGERQLLNFGHSFGHALESSSSYKIPHGIAVALGMLAATHPSWGHLHQSTRDLRDYLQTILTNWTNKQSAIAAIDWHEFEEAIGRDKKNSQSSVKLVLAKSAGSLYFQELPKTRETLSLLTKVTMSSIEELL